MINSSLADILDAIKPKPWFSQLFTAQQKVFKAPGRFKVVTTSRRAGKTILLTTLAAEALENSGPDEVTLYIARTRSAAKELIWQKLKSLSTTHKLNWVFHEGTLRIETPAGGVLLVRGAEGSDPQEEREKIRGLKLRRALLDEPATYSGTLKILLRDVIEPAIGDLNGDIIITGTPGLVQAGSWYEISSGKIPKWKKFHWTIKDNPYFRNSESYLATVLVENHWTEDHPTYQREYLGRWSTDDSVTVYKFNRDRNTVTNLPDYNQDTWIHTIGVDFGMVDASAWSVLASPPHQNITYVIEAFKRTNLLPEQAAEVTQKLVKKYNPITVVGDAGGLGKPYVEAYNRRFGGRMLAANKTEKRAHIELLNGDLQAGRFLLLMPDAESLAEEMEQLPWADESRTKEHPAYPNHCVDSANYSWRHHRAYLATPAPKPAPRITPDSPEFWDNEIAKLNKPWYEV